jgi:hypothetical protein
MKNVEVLRFKLKIVLKIDHDRIILLILLIIIAFLVSQLQYFTRLSSIINNLKIKYVVFLAQYYFHKIAAFSQ